MCTPSTVRRSTSQETRMTSSAITDSHGIEATPGISVSDALPMKAKGIEGLNTVVSAPSRRARPRTAVSEPSVTMKGGSRSSAISAPLMMPKPSPVSTATGSQSIPRSGSFETVSPAIADAARIDPTDRSMPPVRMTKVMPAASTVLTAACCSTMPRFCPVKNRPSDRKWKPMHRMSSTGSMPSALISSRMRWRLLSCAAATAAAAGAVFTCGLSCIDLLRPGGEGHDVFLVQRRVRAAPDLAGDAADTHHDHAVADADDLGQIGGDDEDRGAGLGEIVDDRIDLRLGPD